MRHDVRLFGVEIGAASVSAVVGPAIIYLDNNATTRPLPEVAEAMLRVLGADFGNPSSVHSGGDAARRELYEARRAVASLIGADPDQVLFTSSGTEANNMVLTSVARAEGGDSTFVTTEIEHSSILQCCGALEHRGVAVCRLPPTRSGLIEVNAVADAIRNFRPALVSVQWINNETGVIQPVEALAELCAQEKVLFHSDAAQAVGKIPIDVAALGIDFLTCTAHKFNGPQGVGILFAKQPERLNRMIYGGGQEFGLRAGTENLPGIVGTGVAAALRADRLPRLRRALQNQRDAFEQALMARFRWVGINGAGAPRVCNTSNLRFGTLDGQALVAQFDQAGIRCSQSSACTNLRPEPSYVLRAMGLSEDEAYASIRFSMGADTTETVLDSAVERMVPIIGRLQRILSAVVGADS